MNSQIGVSNLPNAPSPKPLIMIQVGFIDTVGLKGYNTDYV
jgi:hypothetical protein